MLFAILMMAMNKDVFSISGKVSHFFRNYPAKTYGAHQIMIRADEPLEHVYYIIEGRVSQYDIASSGNEVVVNIFKPGAFFPMSTAINNTPNPYFFEASTEVTVRIAPAADVVEFLKNNPDVAFDLLSRVYKGVDGVLRRMAHLMGGNAKSRLAFELINAAYRFGESQDDGSVYVPLTESDIAKHSGLARETVSRAMQELKSADIVRVAQNGIIIGQIAQLEALLGSAL